MRFLIIFCISILQLPALAQNRYDIIISEFLPDPSPVIGLPESSFIELKNRSAQDYNLHNWKISNGTTQATIKSDYILKADSFLILCSTSSVSDYNLFGPALGISGFPALDNDEGEILLTTESGILLHAIRYDKHWFDNEVKAAGGWSLEIIDPSYPCMGPGNWTASVAASGGTPGVRNSVDAKITDEQAPSLIRALTIDSQNIILIFDEPIDSVSASTLSDYHFYYPLPMPDLAYTLPPFFDRIAMHLENPLPPGKPCTISLEHIADCSGNEIGSRNMCKTGIPEKVKRGDIIFNEILFNPVPYGYDYLELYNRSAKIISCSELNLAGRDLSGSLKDLFSLSKENRLLFPGDYLVITENPDWLVHQFPMTDTTGVISVSNLPSMPDDQGKLVLLNSAGEILDELDYDHHWHSPLLVNESGVALERIRSDQPTSLPSNWTSAAASAGYGTPGYKNSESPATIIEGSDFISLEQKIFSPDMDGYQDFCFMDYQLPASGFIGSISIYDIYGNMIRKLVNNEIWSTSGIYRWDGLDDQHNLLPMGHYIIYCELFRPDGVVLKRKLVCTLAR